MCIYTYIYIYTHIYIHTIYIYIHIYIYIYEYEYERCLKSPISGGSPFFFVGPIYMAVTGPAAQGGLLGDAKPAAAQCDHIGLGQLLRVGVFQGEKYWGDWGLDFSWIGDGLDYD